MSRISIGRKKARLRGLFGIRARLVLLALILVAPLMVERVRSLNDMRAKQISAATAEFTKLAQHSADAQREVISSVEALLKSAAYIRASAGGVGRSCRILRSSLRVDLPWIRSMSIVGADGTVQCSTMTSLVGMDLADRSYFKTARETNNFVVSDYLFSRATKEPTIIVAYPVSAVDDGEQAVIIASINLNWLSKIMDNLGGRAGISAVLVDSDGTVVAAPSDQASMIGRSLKDISQLSAIAEKAMFSNQTAGSVSYVAAGGANRAVSFARVSGTNARLMVSIDEAEVSAAIDREIRTAYLQLAFVCLFVFLGALIAAERLIVQPIDIMTAMATRLGRGDQAARAERSNLPAEFVPLAKAFNAMAARLAARERELVATNDRLTVMASIDLLSGLANRRGFQGRLDFEWLKAQQGESELALLMIDVDHFKLFNDNYGHPEGDVCLSRLGEALALIAHQTMGFAARYGGEEFCLLLPDTDAASALRVGERVRAAVEGLAMPHAVSSHRTVTVSVGVAGSSPNEAQQPRELIEAADAALYAAKHRGRNTVVEHGFVRTRDTAMSLAS